jgi:hypothetical protein
VIDPAILTAVQTVYSSDLGLPPDWTPQQRTAFLSAEAEKISAMAASMAEELWEQAIAVWTHTRGRTPDHATKVALLESARAQAARTVLHRELYELIATDETPPPWEIPDPIPQGPVSWEHRWTNPDLQSDPSAELQTLIDQIWPAPQFSAPWRIKAGWLMAARDEDGLPRPDHREDPLTAELAQMIRLDLRCDGLPEQ